MTNNELLALRREYVEAEIEQAGLTGERAELAMSAAMSASDIESDDDFELMVASVIEGAATTEL